MQALVVCVMGLLGSVACAAPDRRWLSVRPAAQPRMLVARATERSAEALGKQGMPVGCRMHSIPKEVLVGFRANRRGIEARIGHVLQTISRWIRNQIMQKLEGI